MIRGTLIKLLTGAVRLFSADGRSEGEFQNREFFQHYGMSSRPLPGAEIIIIREGNHFVSIADGDRRYQIELQDGEVAIHDDLKQKVHLTRSGIVAESSMKISAKAPQIELTGEVKIIGSLEVTEDITVTGSLDVAVDITAGGAVSDLKGSMQDMRDIHNKHTNPQGGKTPEQM